MISFMMLIINITKIANEKFSINAELKLIIPINTMSKNMDKI